MVSVGRGHTVLLPRNGFPLATLETMNLDNVWYRQWYRSFRFLRASSIPYCSKKQATSLNVETDSMDNAWQCDVPPLDEGISYTQVSAGGMHSVFLRNHGTAVACGNNDHGQCDIPELDEGVYYIRVSAGGKHTVLLQSDGKAVAFGRNGNGQCDIPPLDEGISYIEVSAGLFHTVLLRSDLTAVACGDNAYGQCNIPNWWQCGRLRPQWWWTMQHSTFASKTSVYPGFVRGTSYSAPPKWR